MNIRLRWLKDKDAVKMYEWMSDPEYKKYFKFTSSKQSIDNARSFIKNSITMQKEYKKDNSRRVSLHWAVVDDNDDYLGTISLKNIDRVTNDSEYAISLSSDSYGKGIATMATNKLLAYAFESIGVQKIYLNVLADNERAIRFYEKIGFIPEKDSQNYQLIDGDNRRLCWYYLLKKDFNESPIK